MAQGNKQTEELAKASIVYISKYSENDPDDILYCMRMVLNGENMDAAKYKEVLLFTEKIYKKFPQNYFIGDVYAGFLFKYGNEMSAKSEAQKVLTNIPTDKQEGLWSKQFLKKS